MKTLFNKEKKMSIDDIIDEVEVCSVCGAPYVGTSCPNCGHRTKDTFDGGSRNE